MSAQLTTTCSAFSAGQDGVAGNGQTTRLTFAGSWVTEDEYTLTLIFPQTGVVETFGAGALTNQQINFLYTYKDKMNVLASIRWYFSALGNSAKFNDLEGIGNGNISLANNQGISEDLTAMVLYKNRMAVFSPNSVQIWQVDSNPENYVLLQTLQSTGTEAPFSVQALGMLDALYLSGGVRSLQAKETSLDAAVLDIGSPIDQLIIASIDAGTAQSSACSVVEPVSKQYWLYFGGVIYVLSYFTASKIIAWSTFTPNACLSAEANGSVFDAQGEINLTILTPGSVTAYLYYRKGNSTSLETPSGTLTESGYFTVASPGGVITLNGTVGQAYTGEVFRVNLFSSFTPVKMVSYQGVVYILGSNNRVYTYGGETGILYDCTQPVLELPWLDDGSPMTHKQLLAIDAAVSGKWTLEAGADPTSGTLSTIFAPGSDSNPDQMVDSTFDLLRISCELQGTHFKLKATGSATSYKKLKLSGLHVLYKPLNTD